MNLDNVAVPIRQLDMEDMPLLMELEAAAWAAPLQASEATIRRRLALGHTMFGAIDGNVLAGTICFTETSQDPLVPFQQMAWTLASASRSAAATTGDRSNCDREPSPRSIATTRKRAKCAEAPGSAASMAAVSGSSTVLEEGVSMPRRRGLVMRRCSAPRGRPSTGRGNPNDLTAAPLRERNGAAAAQGCPGFHACWLHPVQEGPAA